MYEIEDSVDLATQRIDLVVTQRTKAFDRRCADICVATRDHDRIA